MKRILTLLAIATFASCSISAQDDMYFTPKSKAVKDKEKAEAKAAKEKELAEIRAAEEKRQAEEEARVLQLKKEWLRKNRQHISQTEDGKLVYHAGRDISDDEYNRRGKFASTYAIVSDSVGNDIIEFTAGDGKYPDSLVAYIDTISGTLNIKKKSTDRYDDDDDYYFSRLMNRFDGFYGSRRMWLLYNDPWYSHWAYDPFFWNDPWYWNRSWVYDPWYWNDPWYYGGYYGYYNRYYYGGYYGWTSYHPYHHYTRYHYTPVIIGGVSHNSGHQRNVRVSKAAASPRGYRAITSNIKSQDRKASPRYSTGFSGSRVDRGNTYSNNSRYSSRSNSSSNYSSRSNSSSNYSSRGSSSSNSSSSRGSNYSGSSSSSYSSSSSSSRGSNHSGSSSSSYSSNSRGSSSSSSGGGFRGRR